MAGTRCSRCGFPSMSGARFCAECGQPATAEAGPSVHDLLRRFLDEQVADRVVATGGAIREERRLVTSAFADLSGFSDMASRLDPEELLDAIRPVIGGLSDVVAGYGGHVSKYAGDAILAFFGAPISREDDAERALSMALEMHRVLPSLLPPGVPALELHVGVNSGHVIAHIGGGEVRMDYSLLGEAVVLAQRLESLTPPGDTYVGETTRVLVRDRFEFFPVGPLRLKGYADPVQAFRLLGPARTSNALLVEAKQPLFGRDEELARADEVLARLQCGLPGVLLLTGEPGVGKSRLLAEVRRRASAAGVRWLQAACSSYGEAVPYRPVAELVNAQLQQELPDEPNLAARVESLETAYGLRDVGPYLRRLLGLVGEDGVALQEPEALRRGLHTAVTRWTAALARQGPLVLALEDLHWGDPSTLELLADLLPSCAALPVAVCMTARPEARARAQHLLTTADLPVTVIDLDALGAGALSRMIVGLLDGRPPRELDELVAARSGGNPFFAQEIVRSLQDQGVLVAEEQRWVLRPGWDDVQVPLTVEGVLAARIDQLPPYAVDVLNVAAVVGRRVSLPVLRAVAALDGPMPHRDLDAGVTALTAAGLLERSADKEAVTFRHALVQEVAYTRMLRRHRRLVHQRVAEVVGRDPDSAPDALDLLARHLFLGDAGRPAVEVLLQVGVRDKRLFASAEAVLQLGRAAELGRREAPDLLPDVLAELADLYEMLGDYERAAELYKEMCSNTGDLRGWVGRASTLRRRGRSEEALAVLEAAERRQPAGDLRLIELERSWTLSGLGRFPESVAAAQRGLHLGGPADRVIGLLLLQIARAHTEEGRPEQAIADLDRAMAALPPDDARTRSSALRLLGRAHHAAGRVDDAARALAQGLALAERVGNVEEIVGCLINLGLVELARAELDAAERAVRKAIGLSEEIGHDAGRAIGYNNLAEVLLQRGDLDGADGFATGAVDLATRIGHAMVIIDATLCRATVAGARGDHEGAVLLAQRAARLADDARYAAYAEAARVLEVEQQARLAAVLPKEAESGSAEASRVSEGDPADAAC